MAHPQKTSLTINQKQFTDMISNINRKSFFPVVNGSILNTGKVGTLWGVDVIVSNVAAPKIKRFYTKIIGRSFLHKSVRYQVVHRHKNVYVCDCGNSARLSPFKEFTYYKIKKLL